MFVGSPVGEGGEAKKPQTLNPQPSPAPEPTQHKPRLEHATSPKQRPPGSSCQITLSILPSLGSPP